MAILVSKGGGRYVEVKRTTFPRELDLQDLVFENSEIIPVDEFEGVTNGLSCKL